LEEINFYIYIKPYVITRQLSNIVIAHGFGNLESAHDTRFSLRRTMIRDFDVMHRNYLHTIYFVCLW